jgi:pimeloyl-ACP methyl ester carboxylesterase
MHGITSSRAAWAPLIGALVDKFDVLAIDLPGHGESPPTTATTPEWAEEVAALLDSEGIGKALLVGHSAGGWTALEMAKRGRAEAVLALMPAGLWRKRSPVVTGLALNANWYMTRFWGDAVVSTALRSRLVRSVTLRDVSARPGDVPAEAAIASARTVRTSSDFRRHFSQGSRIRFEGGQEIDVPIKVVWGDKDRIARVHKSRNVDQLPPHTEVETWENCGHMPMWDTPDKLLATIRELAA